MMAFDFFSTSSSDKAGFAREGGGVGALSRLTAEEKKKKGQYKLNSVPPTSGILISVCTTISLSTITLFILGFFTCEIFAWDPVPASSVSASSISASSVPTSSVSTSPVPTSSVPVVGHAGHATHRVSRGPAVSAPPAALLRLSAEASLGDLVLAAPVATAFPTLAAVEPVKPIPVAITPVSVATTLTAGA